MDTTLPSLRIYLTAMQEITRLKQELKEKEKERKQKTARPPHESVAAERKNVQRYANAHAMHKAENDKIKAVR